MRPKTKTTQPRHPILRRLVPSMHVIDVILVLVVLAWALSLFLDAPFQKWFGAGIAIPGELVYLLIGGSLGLRVPAPEK